MDYTLSAGELGVKNVSDDSPITHFVESTDTFTGTLLPIAVEDSSDPTVAPPDPIAIDTTSRKAVVRGSGIPVAILIYLIDRKGFTIDGLREFFKSLSSDVILAVIEYGRRNWESINAEVDLIERETAGRDSLYSYGWTPGESGDIDVSERHDKYLFESPK